MRKWLNWRTVPFIAIFVAMCLLEPVVEASYESSGCNKRNSGESAVYALAGEFRSVIANMLWIKVENYHHEFIREKKDWTENTDTLPLIKMITNLDPQFVEAYLCGSWMLCTGLDRQQEGIAFLIEGIANNPNSMALHEALGTLYARHTGEPAKALPYLRRALQLSADDWDRGRMRRLLRTVQEMADSQPSATP